MSDELIIATPQGLYCRAGDFYIDPWQPVSHAVITHAHGDHLRGGSTRYYCSQAGEGVTRLRLTPDAEVLPQPYGHSFMLGDAKISLHPAGHILGSSQVRVEHGGQVWVVSGDYKRDPDPTCASFEVVECDVFISEATFALPAYRWPDTHLVAREIFNWWQGNKRAGIASVLFAYALGKAQRVLAELTRLTDEPVYVHGAVATLVDAYAAAGVTMLPTRPATVAAKADYRGALVLAPPGAAGSTWLRRFGESSTGFCSGWMRVRGDRRRRGYDRGFVLSDHADWPGLLRTIRDTRASRVLLTHGHTDTLRRYLQEQQVAAAALKTEYGAEE
jgi:putative mRNA 3-end processing factor